MTPDGHWLISGSADKTLRVWDMRDKGDIQCVQVINWYQAITGIQCLPGEGNALPLWVRDEAGALTQWCMQAGRLKFVSAPLQRSIVESWRDSWKTAKLVATQMSRLVRNRIE